MNHRPTTLTTALTAGLVTAALALSACGGSDGDSTADGGDGAPTVEEITQVFVDSGAPEDEAACIAEEVADDLTMDQVRAFAEATDPEEIDSDVLQTIGIALGACTAE